MKEIPVEYYDFEYVKKCVEPHTLSLMLKMLRSGKEGKYIELEKCVKARLKEINPNQQENLPANIDTLGTNEIEEMDSKLKKFEEYSKNTQSRQDRGKHQDKVCNVYTEQAQRLTTYNEITWISSKNTDRLFMINEIFLEDSLVQSVFVKLTKSWLIPKARLMSDEERSGFSVEEREKGNECYRAEQYNDAITHYSKSIIYSNNSKAFSNRAACYLRVEEFENSLRDCNQALLIDCDNVKALIHRATSLIKLDNHIEAKEDLEKLEQIMPDNAIVKKLHQEIKQRKNKDGKILIEEV